MTITELSPLVRRITAGNSSVFTGPGTNTYLVGKEEITVIDPGPAMPEHIENIAKLCEISKDQINIKGKTTEKLGVIGKEKAIACEVIASIVKYD